jgi:hypothetical protein
MNGVYSYGIWNGAVRIKLNALFLIKVNYNMVEIASTG